MPMCVSLHKLWARRCGRCPGRRHGGVCIELRKRKDHFIYTVESTGVLRPEQLCARAIDILAAKCDKLLEHL